MKSLPPAFCFLFLAACSGSGVISPGGNPDGGTTNDPDAQGPIPPQQPTYGTDHPRIYLATNRDRLAAELQDGAPAATRFQHLVDSQLAGANVYGFSPWNAALLGQLTGDTRYCDYAIAQSDAFVASEESSIAAGSRPAVASDSYLDVGPIVGGLMLTYDWCFDRVSDSQRQRWLAYAAQAVWNVWNPNQAVWGGHTFTWSGWAIDDPSDNYYYSFLRATMLFGLAAHDEEPSAAGWLDYFRVHKFEDELVPTFQADLQGGGSREGTGYGTSMMNLWDLYDLWQSSTGEDLARQTTHTRASLLAMMHQIVPTDDRFAPTGDQSRDSTASLFDYQRDYVEELAYLFRDDGIAARAKYLIDHSSVPVMADGFMYVDDFLYGQPDLTATPVDLGTAYYASGIGELYARSSWSSDATWMNLIAGPYTQSHAHEDQGSLMIYKGAWLAWDAGVDSHSGIEQAPENHNLVRIVANGATLRQRQGSASTMLALHRGDGWLHAAADVTPVYGGQSAVSQDQREVVYLEPDTIVVFDRVTTASGTQQVWELNSPAAPSIAGARATFTSGGHTLTVDRVAPESAATSSYAWTQNSDYSGGYRYEETIDGGAQQFLHVLSVDGAVTSVTRDDAGGRTGVTITFTSGASATVRFGASGVDDTLDEGGTSVNLGPGVDSLPE